VFCGVLWCFAFAVFCVRVFSVFHKTAQNRPKSIQNGLKPKRTKRTKYALCNTAQYGAVHISLTQKMSTKNIRKTRPKHCKTSPQNTAKHCFKKNTRKTPQNTRKTPAKYRKTPQNTTKHIC